VTEAEKFLIRSARFTWVVKDPYPEIAQWCAEAELRRSPFFGLFGGWKRLHDAAPRISPHKAWRDGFNFAWELIEKRLATMGEEPKP
jgi:hypothetical protein